MATKKRILIIEDEKALAKALNLRLKHDGYEVMAVNDGEAGLAAVQAQKFDLILLDLIMPKMNGFEVMSKLKAANSKIPIIIISNLSQKEDMEKAMELGAVDYLVKSDTPIKDIVDRIKTKTKK